MSPFLGDNAIVASERLHLSSCALRGKVLEYSSTVKTEIIGHHAKTLELPLLVMCVVSSEG